MAGKKKQTKLHDDRRFVGPEPFLVKDGKMYDPATGKEYVPPVPFPRPVNAPTDNTSKTSNDDV